MNSEAKMLETLEEIRSDLKRIAERQEGTIIYKFRKVSNEQARSEIVMFLRSIKHERTTISIFELSQTLKLPADQVEDILEELEREHRVKLNG